MKIKEILSQHRRDMELLLVCEHCDHEVKRDGYDDRFFHSQVIPSIKCKECGKESGDSYRPLTTKYNDLETV